MTNTVSEKATANDPSNLSSSSAVSNPVDVNNNSDPVETNNNSSTSNNSSATTTIDVSSLLNDGSQNINAEENVDTSQWKYDIYQNTAHANGGTLWNWGTTHNAQDVIIDSYNGSDVAGKDLVVPNSADLIQAGIITDPNAKVYVNPHTFETTKAANSITISGTDGKKVYAVPGHWDQGFGSSNAKYTKLNLTNLDVSAVTGMNGMFTNVSTLREIDGLNTWDMSNVQDTEQMFYGDTNLTSLDLSNWNLKNDSNAHYMFANASNLTSIGDITNWFPAGSRLTNTSAMFYGDKALTSLPGLNSWSTNNVTNTSNMFNGSGLSNVDISNWDIHSLQNASIMFGGMSNLSSAELPASANNSPSLTNMSLMFMDDPNLTSITGLGNLDTSNVTSMRGMFYITPKLTSVDGISNWNTGNVTDMSIMFYHSGVKNLDLRNWNFDNVTNVKDMFEWIQNPITITLGIQHPTKTQYTLEDFVGNSPMVVISSTPAIEALNNDIYVQGGFVKGHENTNILYIGAKNESDPNGAPYFIKAVPMNFVYESEQAVHDAVKDATSTSNIESYLSDYDRTNGTNLSARWGKIGDTSNGSLKPSLEYYTTLFTTPAEWATLPAQVTSVWYLNMRNDAVTYTPTGQAVPTIVGNIPSAENGISNKGDLPTGTTYTWLTTPDVSQPGTTLGIVVVTYPDGSSEQVPVDVIVGINLTDAERYAPVGQSVSTTVDSVPSAADGISNKNNLPTGTAYTWLTTPDVSYPGTTLGIVVVTYPDGSSEQIPVNVIVNANPTDAEEYAPVGQNVSTTVGNIPDAEKGISNKDDLPAGTRYTWLTTPDVSQPGTVSAIVVVTYPDGSSEQIPVDVIISVNPINNESHHGNGESNQSTVLTSNNIVGTPTSQNGNGANHVQMNDLSTAETGQTNKSTTANENLPQTGNSNNGNNLAVLGLGLASLISMFSLGKLNDRH